MMDSEIRFQSNNNDNNTICCSLILHKTFKNTFLLILIIFTEVY